MFGLSNISGMMKTIQSALVAAKSAPAGALPAVPPPEAAAVPKGDSFGSGAKEPVFDDQGNQTGYTSVDAKGNKEEVSYWAGTKTPSYSRTENAETGIVTISNFNYDGKPSAIEEHNYKTGAFTIRNYDENGTLRQLRESDGTNQGFINYDENGNVIYETPSQEDLDAQAKAKAAEEDYKKAAEKENIKNEYQAGFQDS